MGLWQAQLDPYECQGCFGGVRGEERGEVTIICTGCDQNGRKSKKYVPQEGHRGLGTTKAIDTFPKLLRAWDKVCGNNH